METSASTYPVLDEQNRELCPHDESHKVSLEASTPDAVLDFLDRLAILKTDSALLERAEPEIAATVIELSNQGGRGLTARRLLSRDIVIDRTRLRYYESLQGEVMRRFCIGQASVLQVRTLERMVSGLHRRMLASMELLARMDSPAPAIHFRTNQAAVFIGKASQNE
ncbi:MAG TPA: hypothetical protein PLC99_13275 [Verrucomicrobiota bacterium]|nr:hypothetical protein [Verrucomicrobiota bacterium]